MNRPKRILLAGAALLAAAGAGLLPLQAQADNKGHERERGRAEGERDEGGEHEGGRHSGEGARYQRVLLISIDGFHWVDLAKWVERSPASALAKLARHGIAYSNAITTAPSDSFPGMLAQVTGATPLTTGVFYDDSYDRTLYAPGSNCTGSPGAEVKYAENLDRNTARYDAGGTLGKPLTQIDPAKLPLSLAHGACEPVYPHQFLRTNTLFEVIRAQGGRTAWADKHPSYDILNGPSGSGVDDLFTPEIDSDIPGFPGKGNTTSFTAVRNYDATKVAAVLNEIDGLDSTGATRRRVPTMFGMNFQAVSVGQKLATSGPLDPAGLTGGYVDGTGTPGTALLEQIGFVDRSIGQMVSELKKQGEYDSTLIIVSAKHGQSPIDPKQRRAIDDSPYANVPGYGFHIADDAALIWLDPKTRAANLDAAEVFLGQNRTALGIKAILDRDDLVRSYQDPATDSRTPDFFVVPRPGVVYTTGSKLAEHGGVSRDDRNVALLLSAPDLEAATIEERVETTQIAPTILKMVGISPRELHAVRTEHTHVLPRIE